MAPAPSPASRRKIPERFRAWNLARPKWCGRRSRPFFPIRRRRRPRPGLLCSAAIVREVARFFRRNQRRSFGGGSGDDRHQRTAAPAARRARMLRRELLPLATLVTPNLSEAEVLTGKRIRTPEELRAAARMIYQTCGCAALVKGGHLPGGEGGGLSLRRGGRMDAVRAADQRRGAARRRMRLFRRHHRLAGAGKIAARKRWNWPKPTSPASSPRCAG